jgi:hypothetical protein
MEVHFLNPTLVGPVPDPKRPSILLYEPDSQGNLTLTGVEGFVPLDVGTKERPQLFGRRFDGPRHAFGGFGKDLAHGFTLRCDWGSQYVADAWINEVNWLEITISPSYVGEPECTGGRTLYTDLKERCLYLQCFASLTEARRIIGEFIARYNVEWLLRAARVPHAGPGACGRPTEGGMSAEAKMSPKIAETKHLTANCMKLVYLESGPARVIPSCSFTAGSRTIVSETRMSRSSPRLPRHRLHSAQSFPRRREQRRYA